MYSFFFMSVLIFSVLSEFTHFIFHHFLLLPDLFPTVVLFYVHGLHIWPFLSFSFSLASFFFISYNCSAWCMFLRSLPLSFSSPSPISLYLSPVQHPGLKIFRSDSSSSISSRIGWVFLSPSSSDILLFHSFGFLLFHSHLVWFFVALLCFADRDTDLIGPDAHAWSS